MSGTLNNRAEVEVPSLHRQHWSKFIKCVHPDLFLEDTTLREQNEVSLRELNSLIASMSKNSWVTIPLNVRWTFVLYLAGLHSSATFRCPQGRYTQHDCDHRIASFIAAALNEEAPEPLPGTQYSHRSSLTAEDQLDAMRKLSLEQSAREAFAEALRQERITFDRQLSESQLRTSLRDCHDAWMQGWYRIPSLRIHIYANEPPLNDRNGGQRSHGSQIGSRARHPRLEISVEMLQDVAKNKINGSDLWSKFNSANTASSTPS